MRSFDMTNVIMDQEATDTVAHRTQADMKSSVHTHYQLEPVIKELAILKPTWQFRAHTVTRDSFDEKEMTVRYAAVEFRVYEDNEYLGTIKRDYALRGYKICVVNERITSKRERGGGYTTEDPKKAISRV